MHYPIIFLYDRFDLQCSWNIDLSGLISPLPLANLLVAGSIEGLGENLMA